MGAGNADSPGWQQVQILVRSDILMAADKKRLDISETCNRALAGHLGIAYAPAGPDKKKASRVIIAQPAATRASKSAGRSPGAGDKRRGPHGPGKGHKRAQGKESGAGSKTPGGSGYRNPRIPKKVPQPAAPAAPPAPALASKGKKAAKGGRKEDCNQKVRRHEDRPGRPRRARMRSSQRRALRAVRALVPGPRLRGAGPEGVYRCPQEQVRLWRTHRWRRPELVRDPDKIIFLFPEPADPGLVIAQHPQEIHPPEILPVDIGEEELRVHRLPDQKIGQVDLPRSLPRCPGRTGTSGRIPAFSHRYLPGRRRFWRAFLIQSVISSLPLFPIATTTGRPLPKTSSLSP